VPALSRCLLDEHSWIRHNAAMSLAKIGPSARDAIPSLKANVYDEGTYACANAQMAIERLGA
jgi:HEAT repeat protein